ncbi:MAG: hypothetical protein H6R12_1027 [Proteobacteria bacterium]|jgi:hypothetical protein|nr:hypothetical protein [Pseudomonadota bacterium]
MASHFAISSVGESLMTRLRNAYPAALRTRFPCSFQVLSTQQLSERNVLRPTTLALFLYRVTVNEHLRGARRSADPSDEAIPLALDLHWMLCVVADSATAEHTILAWAMKELHANPVLDAASLTPEGGWSPGEVVQLIPAELSNEDLMRIWDAVTPPYHLSVSYVTRVVRIELEPLHGRPVVATRLAVQDQVP